MFQQRSVGTKRAFILGIAVTAFFFGKMYYDIHADRELALRTAEQQARGLAGALNEHALRTFNDAEGTIDSVIRGIEAVSEKELPSEQTLQRIFASHQRAGSVLATLFVANPDGFLRGISTEFPVRPVRVTDREYFQHHRNARDGALFISKPFRNRLDNAWIITVSKRVANVDGTMRMIVGVALHTSYFSNFYSTLEMDRSDRILLIRRDGAILSLEPFSEQMLLQNLAARERGPEVNNFPGSGTYQATSPVDGTQRIRSYRSSPTYPVVAVVSLDKAVHLRQWRARTVRELAGAGMLLALVATLAFLIRRQLQSLTQVNQRLSSNQHELREAKRRSQEIVNSIDGIVWEVDLASFCFTFVSRRSEAITGLPCTRWLGDPLFWSSRVHPDDASWADWFTPEASDFPADATFEYRFRKDDGSYLWLRDIVTVVSKAGQPISLRGVMLDISQAKQAEQAQRDAEEALRLSEQRFRGMLENIHLLSMILNTDGKVTFCNDFLLQLTGWKRHEVLGADWFAMFLPLREAARVRAVFEEGIARAEIPAHFENPIVTKEGEYRFITWDNTVLHNPDGTLAGIASIGMDMTQHRALEEQLRQSQKMEATGLLAGGIAHDFNNILTVIIGYCSVMQMRMPQEDPNRASVDQVLAAAERAAGLTRSLLAFSRKQVMNPHQADLNAIVRHVEHFLCRVIGEDISLRTELYDEELYVQVDSGQIEQIMMNLATNARDAMPGGGVLSVSTQVVDTIPVLSTGSGVGAAGRYALLTVSDTGTGMDEATMAKIFEPFFTTKEVGKGTGLGLAMAYGTVMQHNGQIAVESEPGKGTSFKVYLPLVAYQEPEPKQESSPFELHSGNELILVAEDEPAVRDLVEGILLRFGYRVLLACDGEDAVAKFEQHRDEISLVLLDMIMPKMSGKAAYDQIISLKPGTKAIFTSGYTADVIRSKGELGPDMELIMKPAHPLLLLRKVRELLDR
jgi:PAS domain S-box-containing protein